MRVPSLFFALSLALCASSCGASPTPDKTTAEATETVADSQSTDASSDEVELFTSFREIGGIDDTWTGDLDAIIERGYLRALVTYSKTHYFLDGARQRGIAYESLVEFERFLNQQLGMRHIRVEVLILPVGREEILPALERGLGDLAVANLTITPERSARVDFSMPVAKNVREVLVTGPEAPDVKSLDDLAGQSIHLRPSSSYWQSVVTLNRQLSSRSLEIIKLKDAEEYLEDEDLLELVSAGMLPWVVVDEPKARFWADVLDGLTVREDLVFRSGAQIGWAFRKHSPQLAEMVNSFVRKNRQGTLFGNVILKRYLESNPWIRNNLSTSNRQRLETVLPLFERYGNRYDLPPLVLVATGFQESGLDQSKRSAAGAVGVMQIKPSTAADRNVAIPDIDQLENNIHAGTKYLAFLRDRYFSGSELDRFNRVFFTLAAYNAGPARVRQLRAAADAEGLNPDVWFGQVEQVAARRIGRETVRYVSNIAKYAFAYELVYGEAREPVPPSSHHVSNGS